MTTEENAKNLVVHTRGEVLLNGSAAFRWSITITNIAHHHSIDLLDCGTESVRDALAFVVRSVNGSRASGGGVSVTDTSVPKMPPLSVYMSKEYFNW
jgi:hypothetical protein